MPTHEELQSEAQAAAQRRLMLAVASNELTVRQGYYCSGCENHFEEEDCDNPTYECAEGHTFSRDESENDTHQCPECHKFGSKTSDYSCPEGCGDPEEHMSEIEILAWHGVDYRPEPEST